MFVAQSKTNSDLTVLNSILRNQEIEFRVKLFLDATARLEYRDVKIIDDAGTGETILEIEVRGKRGVGYCKSTSGAVRPFQCRIVRHSSF